MGATRASLSLTEPNDAWIQQQIDSGEYTSRSEVVNDVIRKAREVDLIRARLIAAEQSVEDQGWSQLSSTDLLASIKQKHVADV